MTTMTRCGVRVLLGLAVAGLAAFIGPGAWAQCGGTIGDFVWSDTNGNGFQDLDERGLNGVTLTLVDSTGATLATTVTGPSPSGEPGFYSFQGLCAGTYTVNVTAPAGSSATTCGTDLTLPWDSNCSGVQVPLANDNTSNLTIDFGFTSECKARIGDFVWRDHNENGLQDENDGGIDGVKVHLADSTGASLGFVTTGPAPNGRHGYYEFPGLCAATYTITVDTPEGFESATPCSADATIMNDANCSPATVALAANDTDNPTIDFGFVSLCDGAIGDFVWQDTNKNGLQDAGEPGLDGVTVNLLDATGNVLATTTSGPGQQADTHGVYEFKNLCAGTYSVDVKTPHDMKPTAPCSDDTTTNGDSNCSPAQVTLAIHEVNRTIDFGFVPEEQEQEPSACGPGFWKQPQHFGWWTAPYTPASMFSDVFEDAFPGKTLLQVLQQGGGGLNALGRQTVAALLNAASPKLNSGSTPQEVIDQFNAAFPDTNGSLGALESRLGESNDGECPLGNSFLPGFPGHGQGNGQGDGNGNGQGNNGNHNGWRNGRPGWGQGNQNGQGNGQGGSHGG